MQVTTTIVLNLVLCFDQSLQVILRSKSLKTKKDTELLKQKQTKRT
jgi:hypothetical protein